MAGGVDPRVVRRHLRRVEPELARVRVAPGWFRRLWAKGVVAVCMPWAVYVRPDVMARHERGDDPEAIARLIVHELAHLEQYRRLGGVRHVVRYLSDYVVGRRRGLSHWDAYRAIGLEREARYLADMITTEAWT